MHSKLATKRLCFEHAQRRVVLLFAPARTLEADIQYQADQEQKAAKYLT